MTDHVFLTPEETAELLRVTSEDVMALIECGDVAAFEVAGKWRVTLASVKDFVTSRLRKQNVRALERALSDHSMWARILEEDPAFVRQLEGRTFDPNTMGAFLQEALAVSRSTRSGQVIPMRSRDGDKDDS